jgi:hypothetical protein
MNTDRKGMNEDFKKEPKQNPHSSPLYPWLIKKQVKKYL